MLSRLDDPHTFVSKDDDQSKPIEMMNSVSVEKHIIYLRLNDFEKIDSTKVDSLLQKTLELSYKEKGIIIDLRSFTEQWLTVDPVFKRNKFVENLIQTNLTAPAYNYLSYSGFPCEKSQRSIYQKQNISTNYYSDLAGLRKENEIPILVIVNSMSNAPADIITLSLNDKATLISTEKKFYAGGNYIKNEFYTTYLQLDYWAVNQKIYSSYIHKFLDKSIDESELKKIALKILKSKTLIKLPTMSNISKKTSDSFKCKTGLPEKDERILALAKLYTVTKYFNPHDKLMTLSPADNFRKILPDVIAANDSLEYSLALAKYLANLNDSHCMIESNAFMEHFFSAGFPFEVLKLENKFYISKLYDEEYAEKNNLKPGDEILTMNNRSVTDIFEYTNQYISSSNPNRADYYVSNRMLNGALDDSATFTLRRGRERIITTLDRIGYDDLKIIRKTRQDTIKILESNFAYVNLDLLAKDRVKSMLDKIKNCDGVIFDVRGYPNSIIWELSTLITADKVLTSRLVTPVFNSRQFWGSFVTSDLGETYVEGKEKRINVPIVVLMNSQTQSHAEYTCSAIKELTGATLIGEQTSGADGNVSNIKLPGNVFASFTGMDPQDPRGNSQQGIGLLPDIEVRPTLEGIKAGKDEVLEATIEFLGDKIGK